MAKQFTTEIRESHDKYYLKVFFYDQSNISRVKDGIKGLSSVRTANITENTKDDLTVYPSPTCDIEETQQDVEQFLNKYFE
jgi:hypothetical protein